jgi:hypothetical protein
VFGLSPWPYPLGLISSSTWEVSDGLKPEERGSKRSAFCFQEVFRALDHFAVFSPFDHIALEGFNAGESINL